MGGAQPLAATMNGAAARIVEVDRARIARRLANGYLDEATDSLDDEWAANITKLCSVFTANSPISWKIRRISVQMYEPRLWEIPPSLTKVECM
jgi:urocanate hydratase